jgi:hypothetical protein
MYFTPNFQGNFKGLPTTTSFRFEWRILATNCFQCVDRLPQATAAVINLPTMLADALPADARFKSARVWFGEE